jgi:uncharacterized membrane protein YcaP (DUF421 family)
VATIKFEAEEIELDALRDWHRNQEFSCADKGEYTDAQYHKERRIYLDDLLHKLREKEVKENDNVEK